ncbi:MAG: metal ABC transporter ATP-binding protein [Candidatus Kapaibacteriota bacterium]
MIDPVVEIYKLSVFFGKYCVLNGLDLLVRSLDFLTIVGPNGGGKTTLIKTILGLIEPNSGSVRVFGKKPNNVDFEDIGYVPQIKTIDRSFPGKVYELVANGRSGRWKFTFSNEIRQRVKEVLSTCGLEHLEDRQINKLSGGELQRVFLARCFIRKPKLLLLDEPATGIDFIAETDFSFLLEKLQKENQTTIIMVTHDWEYAYYHSTSVLLLNKSVVAYGKPQNVFTEDNLRRTFGHLGHEHNMDFLLRKND